MITKEHLLELGFTDGFIKNHLECSVDSGVIETYDAERFVLVLSPWDEYPKETELNIQTIEDLQTLIKILSNGK